MIETGIQNESRVGSLRPFFLAATAVAGLYFSQFAFSRKVRKEIIERDQDCVWKNSHCYGGLEAAHINHDRDNPLYDDASNGMTLCTYHHRRHHKENEGFNGLTKKQNRWAIRKITERLSR